MSEYYNGSISQEARFTNVINYQSNIKLLQDELYNECLLSQFNLENLGINYLADYDIDITFDLYERVIVFIDKSYIHINGNNFIFDDDNKKFMFGKVLYELFFVNIPSEDIYEFDKEIDKNGYDNIGTFLIDYYITKTKRYESLKHINNNNSEIDYLIFKNSIAANLFDGDLVEFKNKYLRMLISKL